MNTESTNKPEDQGGFFALPHPPKLSEDAYEGAQRSSAMSRPSKRRARGGDMGAASSAFKRSGKPS
ncbi:MAG: hypothetical protein PW734_00395 [Verrucomicrobium sp.]|nr:hypothetical protein [Verrucomicrobium sp.]